MRAIDAVKQITDKSPMSQRAISAAMGHAPTWLSSTFVHDDGRRDMHVGTLSQVASICGYVLALVPDAAQLPDGAMVIDARTSHVEPVSAISAGQS